MIASTTYLTSVVGYEYVVLDGVCHPVHRATAEGEMTPWRWNGEPCTEPSDAGIRAEIGHRLPDEEHGYEWGPPMVSRPTMLWHLTVMGSSESDGLVPEEDRELCSIGEWVRGEPGEASVFVDEIPRDCADPSRLIRERARGGYS